MGVGPRRFEFVKAKNGSNAVPGLEWYKVLGSGRSTIIVPGRFAVQISAGDDSSADGATDANSTTATRLFLGLIDVVADANGVRLDRQYLATDEAGLIGVIPVRNNVFRGVEDGDGGVLTSYTTGYAGIIHGTVNPGAYSAATAESHFPVQFPNDKINSSDYTTTAANGALKLLGAAPFLENATVTNKVVEFEIHSDYLA
jgi:hypothetical protein